MTLRLEIGSPSARLVSLAARGYPRFVSGEVVKINDLSPANPGPRGNPKCRTGRTGPLMKRKAARRYRGSLLHKPPRSTRYVHSPVVHAEPSAGCIIGNRHACNPFHPVPYIAVNLIKPPRIGLEGLHRQQSFAAIRPWSRHCRCSFHRSSPAPPEIWNAPHQNGGRSPSPRSIFALRLRKQPVLLASSSWRAKRHIRP